MRLSLSTITSVSNTDCFRKCEARSISQTISFMNSSQFNSSEHVTYFHIADYVVFVLTLVISAAIGVYYAFSGGRQRTATEYLLGNRNMGLLPITLSLFGSFNSSIALLGVPSEVYTYTFNYYYVSVGMVFMCPVVAYCYLPVFYNLKVTSIYEYLERRFCRKIRLLGSVIYITQMTTYVAFVVYGPSLALAQVTGFHLWGSIAAISAVGTIYTVIGGIKAVMWTDVFQVIIMFGSMFIVIGKGTYDAGGVSAILQANAEGLRLEPLSFSFDPRLRYTFWILLFSSCIFWSSIYATNQTQVQRYLASPSLKRAQITVWLNVPGLVLLETMITFTGLILYAAYRNCDPLSSNQIQQPDQILPHFVMRTFRGTPGVPGLFVAGLYCGSLSTVSSALNSLAAVTLHDFVLGVPRWKNLSEEKCAKVSMCLALIYGFVCLVFIVLFENLGGILQAFTVNSSMFCGVTLGIFTLALFNPKADSLCAFMGLLTGTGFGLWVCIGSQYSGYIPPRPPISIEGCVFPNSTFNFNNISLAVQSVESNDDVFELYKISYLLSIVVTFTSVIIGGTICSFFRGTSVMVDNRLLSPVTVYFRTKLNKTQPEQENQFTQNGAFTKEHELPMLQNKFHSNAFN